MSNNSSSGGTLEAVSAEFTKLLSPIGSAAKSAQEGDIEALLVMMDEMNLGEETLGKDAEIVAELLKEIAPAWKSIESAIIPALAKGNVPPPSKVVTAIESISDVFDTIRKLEKIDPPDDFPADNLADAVIDYLLLRYLKVYRPTAFMLLSSTDIVQSTDPAEIDFSNLGKAISKPEELVADSIDWGTQEFKIYFIFGLLENALEDLGLMVSQQRSGTIYDIHPDYDTNPSNVGLAKTVDELEIPVLSGNYGSVSGETGIRFVPYPEPQNDWIGVALIPYAQAGVNQTVDLGGGWTFTIDSKATGVNFAVIIRPTSSSGGMDVSVKKTTKQGLGSSLPNVKADAKLEYSGSTADGDYRTLISTDDGTGVRIGSIAARTSLEYDGSLAIALELPTEGKIVIKPKGGFLEKVLPEKIESDFSTNLGWSIDKGVYFEGGATLEVPLPMHKQLGPITLKEIHLAVSPDPKTGKITTEASAAATVNIGPVTGTVERMGIEADLSFPEKRDGNFGPVNLDVGFSPPKGIGLSLSAGPVKGSGYLFFDPENERYGGAAQLKASKVTASAVGLITTELPDGSDGFSMQVIVAGQFPPIQLGWGFTLTGVGGLAGIHRKFRKRPLRKVVRKGNLDSVLFPKRKTVKNSPQRLLSDIRSIFPPRRDSYVFGPMVQLGYGTPAILKASLGVVLEIPSFRIAILGRFELVLPNHAVKKPPGMPEKAPFPPVVLNLDVIGIIDIPGKSISIDGTLYDSRWMKWKVEGDLALRSSWGETSRFILSIGGFHERYPPPKDAPGLKKLDRVKVSLDVPGGQPVLNFTGYFAVTANTVQIGAKVYAELSLGKFKIWGRIEFDALIEFKPFKFIFDFLAKFMIEAPGFTMNFKLEGTIKGPNPLNINGKVKLQAGPVKVSTKFDLTLGPEKQAESLPPAEVLPELKEALGKSDNWNAQLPADGNSLARLGGADPEKHKKDGSGKSRPVRAHPRGSLTIRQSVVPLEYTIEKFGENTPKTFEKFEIESISVAGETNNDPTDVAGEFAPAKYRKMSDAEKLEKPDFVERTAGTTVGGAKPLIGDTKENIANASFVYEEIVEDDGLDVDNEPVENVQSGSIDFGARTHTDHSASSLVEGRSSASGHDRSRFDVTQQHPPDDDGDGSGGTFTVKAPEYVVVDESQFEVVSVSNGASGNGSSGDGSGGNGRMAGMSLEEAKRRIETAARRGEYDADSLTVMRKDRIENESWLAGEGNQ